MNTGHIYFSTNNAKTYFYRDYLPSVVYGESVINICPYLSDIVTFHFSVRMVASTLHLTRSLSRHQALCGLRYSHSCGPKFSFEVKRRELSLLCEVLWMCRFILICLYFIHDFLIFLLLFFYILFWFLCILMWILFAFYL